MRYGCILLAGAVPSLAAATVKPKAVPILTDAQVGATGSLRTIVVEHSGVTISNGMTVTVEAGTACAPGEGADPEIIQVQAETFSATIHAKLKDTKLEIYPTMFHQDFSLDPGLHMICVRDVNELKVSAAITLLDAKNFLPGFRLFGEDSDPKPAGTVRLPYHDTTNFLVGSLRKDAALELLASVMSAVIEVQQKDVVAFCDASDSGPDLHTNDEATAKKKGFVLEAGQYLGPIDGSLQMAQLAGTTIVSETERKLCVYFGQEDAVDDLTNAPTPVEQTAPKAYFVQADKFFKAEDFSPPTTLTTGWEVRLKGPRYSDLKTYKNNGLDFQEPDEVLWINSAVPCNSGALNHANTLRGTAIHNAWDADGVTFVFKDKDGKQAFTLNNEAAYVLCVGFAEKGAPSTSIPDANWVKQPDVKAVVPAAPTTTAAPSNQARTATGPQIRGVTMSPLEMQANTATFLKLKGLHVGDKMFLATASFDHHVWFADACRTPGIT